MKDHVQPLKKHKESDCCTSSPAFAWLLLLCEAAEYPLQENDTVVVDLYSVFAWDSLYLSKLSNVEFCTNIRRAEKTTCSCEKQTQNLYKTPQGAYLQDRFSMKYQQQF